MNRRSFEQQTALQSSEGQQQTSTSIQPSQRKTKQQRKAQGNSCIAGAGANLAPAEGLVESQISHRKQMKESMSQAHLGNNNNSSTKTKVPRLNLNLSVHGAGGTEKKHSTRHMLTQSLDNLPSAASGRLENSGRQIRHVDTMVQNLISPKQHLTTYNEGSTSTKFANQSNHVHAHQQSAPQHRVLIQGTGGQITAPQQQAVQFTPVRAQQAKGQPLQQSKRQAVTQLTPSAFAVNHYHLSSQQQESTHHSYSVESSQHQQLNSFRSNVVPPGFATKSITYDRVGNNALQFQTTDNLCEDDSVDEFEGMDDDDLMEFDNDTLAGQNPNKTNDPILVQGRPSRMGLKRDEILDNTVSDVTAQSESEIISFHDESNEDGPNSQKTGQHQQRVPREDRKRRRIQQAAIDGNCEGPNSVGVGQQTLQTLIEQTSKNASWKVEQIVQERIKSRRSCSRSSRKSRQKSGNQTTAECFNSSQKLFQQQPQGASIAPRQLNNKSVNSQYQSGLMHQYPKFDIDLSNFVQDGDHLKNSENNQISKNENTVIRQVINPEQIANSSEVVRVNKFGSTQADQDTMQPQSRGVGSRGRRMSETRSNVSQSITRRKQENGGVSESLNRLVQSSVQNLSKILQRPGTSQVRSQFSEIASDRETSFELQRAQDSHRQCFMKPTKQDEHPKIDEEEDNRNETTNQSNTASLTQNHESVTSITPEPYCVNTVMLFPNRRSPEPTPQPINPRLLQKQTSASAVKPRWDISSTNGGIVQISATLVSGKRSPRATQTSKHTTQLMNYNQVPLASIQPAGAKSIQASPVLQNKNDLSVIAESIDQKTSKTYMSLTATAVARKEAITVKQQQRKLDQDAANRAQISQRQSAATLAAAAATATAAAGVKQQQTQSSAARYSTPNTVWRRPQSLSGQKQKQQQDHRFAMVTTIQSDPLTNQAASIIQRQAKVLLQWRRLRLLASMRAMIYAMTQGHRVRQFLAQPAIRTMTKEITLCVRRENKQPANYLKEQSRKKLKASIIHLIAACDAYPGSPPIVEIPPSMPQMSHRSQARSVTDSSSATGQSSNNTNNLFKKRDVTNARYRQAVTPVTGANFLRAPPSNNNLTSVVTESTPKKAQKHHHQSVDQMQMQRQNRAQTARQNSMMMMKPSQVTNNHHQPQTTSSLLDHHPPQQHSRNNITGAGAAPASAATAQATHHQQSSTLYKATKSYQMKIIQAQHQTYQQSATASGAPTPAQNNNHGATTSVNGQSSTAGKSIQDTRSSAAQKESNPSKTPLPRQGSVQRGGAGSKTATPNSAAGRALHRSKSKSSYTVAQNEPQFISTSILSPKGASRPESRVLLERQNHRPPFTLGSKTPAVGTTLSCSTPGTAQVKQRKSSTLINRDNAISQRKSPVGQRAAAGQIESLQQSSHRTACTTTSKKQTSSGNHNQQQPLREKSRQRMARSPTGMATESKMFSKKASMSSENVAGATIPRKPQLPPQARNAALNTTSSPSKLTKQQSCTITGSKTATMKTGGNTSNGGSNLNSATKVASSSLNTSFHRPTGSVDKQSDLTTPVRQSRQQRQQQRTNQTNSKPAPETVQLSLLELEIPNPKVTTAQTVTSKVPDLRQKSSKTQSKKDFPVAVSIRELLEEMDNRGNQAANLTEPDPSLLDFQAQKRLQLERLIIDLRRDFEMSCLEQRSNQPSESSLPGKQKLAHKKENSSTTMQFQQWRS